VASVLLINQGSLHQVFHHGVFQTEAHEVGDDHHHSHELNCAGHAEADGPSFCSHEQLCEWCTVFSAKTFYKIAQSGTTLSQPFSLKAYTGYLSPLFSLEIDQPATRGPPAIA